jgi:pimeloyl-ACP methyl ester carboxylesterase
MEEKYLNNKNKIYYRINKQFNKKSTLFFVHGASGSSSAWEKYEKKFMHKYNIISIDLRGHGKSFRPKKIDEYQIKHFASDILNIIKKEKLKNIILVSHSFGNFPVIEFLKKHQKYIIGSILVSPDSNPAKTKIVKLTKSFLIIMPFINLILRDKKTIGHVNYNHYYKTGDWNLRRTYADVKNTGLKSFLNSLMQLYSWNGEDILNKIKIPILIVHGEKDTILPIESGKHIAKKIKGAKLTILKKANHIIVLNFFEELSEIIDKFARSINQNNKSF